MYNRNSYTPTPISEPIQPTLKFMLSNQGLLLTILIFLVVFFFGATVFLAYQNRVLQNEIVNLENGTLIVNPTPTP